MRPAAGTRPRRKKKRRRIKFSNSKMFCCGGARNVPKMVAAMFMSEGRRSQVVLLDERRLDIVIQSRLYAGELLDIVASHFNLKEKEYFGISYIDECGEQSWLHLEKRVLEHDFPKKSSSQGTTLTLYFRIKYFVESITQLRDSATIEAFYLQTKSLISKGDLEIDSEIIFQLAALVIQATYGDYSDDQLFKCHLKRLPVLPLSTLKEYPSIAACEAQVLEHYKVLAGQARGAAIVNYLSIVESLPTYGQHYYEIKDKAGNPCLLSLSYRGISQYDKNDRRTPRRIFLWKQLENLYFRDRKFTVEVHEARRVVHTLSSFNLYEDAIEEPVEEFDDLSNAICDPTTQVSVSRRALAPASVTVYVWYAASPNIAKCIWSMAIAQHQFFLDRNHKKSSGRMVRSLSQIASELSRSVQSLSSLSSHSNISRSNSSTSLPTVIVEGEISEESRAATAEMLSALQSRKDALQDALKKKTEELKALCLKEGELTGELPPETPFQPGEPQPQVRRRVGTSFTISDKVFYKTKGKDRETLNDLELDYEIQSKIASAALKLANDHSARKSVRKLRKISYHQATTKLRDIEEKLSTLKREKESQRKIQKAESLLASSSENSISSRSNLTLGLNGSSVPPSASLPHLSGEPVSTSAPSSPAKGRQRHQSLQHVPPLGDDVYEDVLPYLLPPRRPSSSAYSAAASTEYDALSCGGSSVHSLGIPYRNRFETSLDIEGTNHYSVPNRRASQVFANDPDDMHSDAKSQDTLHYCADAPPPHPASAGRFLATPLSCSYDERLYGGKSGGGYCSPVRDCGSYDKVSVDGLGCADSAYQLPFAADPRTRVDGFGHAFSENSLHRTGSQSGSVHFKLSQLHISEPELSPDPPPDAVDGPQRYVVRPPRKNGLPPVAASLDYSPSSGLNQVADLVQASVLLQDCKRATSSTSLDVPKPKKKEWLETSLDSPVLTRKRRPRAAPSEPPCCEQPEPAAAHWLENGLPPVPEPPFFAYTHDLPHHQSPPGDLRRSPMPSKPPHDLVPHPAPDDNYRQLNPTTLFPENGPYHHHRLYENVDDLSRPPHRFYEDSSPGPPDEGPPVAQPQEPPRLPGRGYTLESAREVVVHDLLEGGYEPVDFPEQHRPPHRQHCDSLEKPPYPCPYSPSQISKECVSEEGLPQQVSQGWQHYSPPRGEAPPTSPPPQGGAFSPAVEVNVVSVGHFQPYWEETKPYEISDFYKYSTKHRRQQQRGGAPPQGTDPPEEVAAGARPQEPPPPLSASTPGPPDYLNSSAAYCERGGSDDCPSSDPDKSLSLGDVDLRISLADTFHDEMVAWYQTQESVKKATLV